MTKKVALVTGGSRGIGKAVATQLAKDGFYVLVNYLSNKIAAGETLNEIHQLGGEGKTIQFDVANREQVENALTNWKNSNEGRIIEILINNAGIRRDNLFIWTEPEQWDQVIQTNLNSIYYVTRHLIQDMILNKFGRIVNIVSLSGLKGMAGQVNYSAAKAGVVGATKALAQEVGKKNITVNAVAPGFIRTEMTQDLDEGMLKKLVPLNRFGTAEEVADLVSFLVSDRSAYITGEVISINGGLYT